MTRFVYDLQILDNKTDPPAILEYWLYKDRENAIKKRTALKDSGMFKGTENIEACIIRRVIIDAE